jgi:flavin-dependent dehydrogenase
VESIQAGAVRAGDANVACKWIIGADGHNSLVRRLARLGSAVVRQRIGVSQHYSVRPWTDFVEVYWHRRGQAYVTPVAAGMMNVVLMGNGENLRIPDLAELFPRLAERLKGTHAVGSPYSDVTASFVLESVIREHVALVGDASGSVDAVTGEGLSLAFRQALALAAGLRDNDLTAYQSAHRRMIRPPRMMAALLLTMGSREWLLRRAVHALATHSTAFARLMAIHTGEISPRALRIREVAGLFWRLVTASGDTPRGIEAL